MCQPKYLPDSPEAGEASYDVTKKRKASSSHGDREVLELSQRIKGAGGNRSRAVALEELQENFHLPINEVACKLGVCVTVLKQQCRELGITRWPYRKVRKLDNMLNALETAGPSKARPFALTNGEDERQRKITTVKQTLRELISDPNSSAHLKLGKVRNVSTSTAAAATAAGAVPGPVAGGAKQPASKGIMERVGATGPTRDGLAVPGGVQAEEGSEPTFQRSASDSLQAQAAPACMEVHVPAEGTARHRGSKATKTEASQELAASSLEPPVPAEGTARPHGSRTVGRLEESAWSSDGLSRHRGVQDRMVASAFGAYVPGTGSTAGEAPVVGDQLSGHSRLRDLLAASVFEASQKRPASVEGSRLVARAEASQSRSSHVAEGEGAALMEAACALMWGSRVPLMGKISGAVSGSEGASGAPGTESLCDPCMPHSPQLLESGFRRPLTLSISGETTPAAVALSGQCRSWKSGDDDDAEGDKGENVEEGGQADDGLVRFSLSSSSAFVPPVFPGHFSQNDAKSLRACWLKSFASSSTCSNVASTDGARMLKDVFGTSKKRNGASTIGERMWNAFETSQKPNGASMDGARMLEDGSQLLQLRLGPTANDSAAQANLSGSGLKGLEDGDESVHGGRASGQSLELDLISRLESKGEAQERSLEGRRDVASWERGGNVVQEERSSPQPQKLCPSPQASEGFSPETVRQGFLEGCLADDAVLSHQLEMNGLSTRVTTAAASADAPFPSAASVKPLGLRSMSAKSREDARHGLAKASAQPGSFPLLQEAAVSMPQLPAAVASLPSFGSAISPQGLFEIGSQVGLDPQVLFEIGQQLAHQQQQQHSQLLALMGYPTAPTTAPCVSSLLDAAAQHNALLAPCDPFLLLASVPPRGLPFGHLPQAVFSSYVHPQAP